MAQDAHQGNLDQATLPEGARPHHEETPGGSRRGREKGILGLLGPPGSLWGDRARYFSIRATRRLPTSSTLCVPGTKRKLTSLIAWPSTRTAPCPIRRRASLVE